MSQLLQSISRSSTGAINAKEAGPDRVVSGIPLTIEGYLSYEQGGIIDHYHQGLPFTAAGRIAGSRNGTIDRVGNGGAPFDASNRLALTTTVVQYTNTGIPYGVVSGASSGIAILDNI